MDSTEISIAIIIGACLASSALWMIEFRLVQIRAELESHNRAVWMGLRKSK